MKKLCNTLSFQGTAGQRDIKIASTLLERFYQENNRSSRGSQGKVSIVYCWREYSWVQTFSKSV